MSNDRFKFRNPTERYRHTPKGVLTNCYHKQVERCKKYGRDLPGYSLKDFQERFLHDYQFLLLFQRWQESGFDTKLKPSFDRIDATRSYTFGNICVMTWAENRKKGDFEKSSIYTTPVYMYSLDGKILKEFESTKDAVMATGFNQSLITGCCRGKYKQTHGVTFRYRGDKFRFKNINAIEIIGTIHEDQFREVTKMVEGAEV